VGELSHKLFLIFDLICTSVAHQLGGVIVLKVGHLLLESGILVIMFVGHPCGVGKIALLSAGGDLKRVNRCDFELK
jgi:hypothetical protein